MSISDFLLFVKNGIMVGVRSLKVTAHHLNKAGCCYEYNIRTQCHASLGATQYNAACQTHLPCTLNLSAAGRQRGREAEKERGRMEDGREGARGGWEGRREQGNTREGGREREREGEGGEREGEIEGGREGGEGAMGGSDGRKR